MGMLLHLDYLPFQLLTCYGCGYSSVTTMPAICPQCNERFTEVMITFMDGSRTEKSLRIESDEQPWLQTA
jgi:hypothetical protein